MIQLRALAERLRGSLFYVPVLFVVGSAALAWLTSALDRTVIAELDELAVVVATTVDSARSILSTIAGATITVAGIVFSVTVVAVQLASTQYSPRVLRNFLRDRFQQNVIGIVVATFTYCMFVLASIRVSGPDAETDPAPSLAVTVAIVLAVASILAIVGFIDHTARSMQAGRIIERVTAETRKLLSRTHTHRDEDQPADPVSPSPPPWGAPRHVVRSWTDGWVQQISPTTILGAMPPGSYARLDTRVGAYVVADTVLLTVWGDEAPRTADLRPGFVIGGDRTMQQDIAFGFRQLVDVALRALSTGVNDPTTAEEVVVHLGSLLADLFAHDLPGRTHRGDEGRVLVVADRVDHAQLVDLAFEQIRLAASAQPAVLVRLLGTIETLDRLAVDLGLEHARRLLRPHVELVIETVEHGDLPPSTRDHVLAVARGLDVLDEVDRTEDR